MKKKQFDILTQHMRAIIALQVLQIGVGLPNLGENGAIKYSQDIEEILKKYNLLEE